MERNPAVGVKVQVPQIEPKVLTNEEVKTFLREARATQHRFSPIWILTLWFYGSFPRIGNTAERSKRSHRSRKSAIHRKVNNRAAKFIVGPPAF